MKPPVVGRRYKVGHIRAGSFVGRCVWVEGEDWEFKLESFVAGLDRDWGIGDELATRAAYVVVLDEIPLDAGVGGA